MRRIPTLLLALTLAAPLTAQVPGTAPRARASRPVQVAWDRLAPAMTPQELERARHDMSWHQVVGLDPAPGTAIPNPERWEQISAQTVNSGPQLPSLHGDVAGPSVLRTQILLDHALFSPGIMDGRGARTRRRRCTGSSAARGCAPRRGWTAPPSRGCARWPAARGSSSSAGRSPRWT